MKWNVRTLFTGEREELPIEDALDLSDLERLGEHPFTKPVFVHGAVTGTSGIVVLRALVEFTFEGSCDRCLARFSRSSRLEIEHLLILSEKDSDDENAVVVGSSFELDLDELIQADLWLEMPMKSLCRPDCRGLCPHCGKDLNEGPCGCSKKEPDPRLAALQQLLQS